MAVSVWACALATGCNSLLGNADHEVAEGGAAASAVPPDGGSVGVWGSISNDAGAAQGGHDGGHDAERAGPGDAAGSEPIDGGGGDDGPVAAAPIAFVQAASQDSKASATSVSATYAHPQRAGDLSVVVVGWSDKARAVTALSDSAGTAYTLALAPPTTTGASLAIYYGPSVASAASNTVTVTLDAADFPCLALLEYAGVSEVDQTATSSGAGIVASSGTVVTSVPRELVFGAGQPDQRDTANFAGAGPGFDERVITGTSGMLAEDTVVSQVGTYSATGALTKSSSWVMQVVTFK